MKILITCIVCIILSFYSHITWAEIAPEPASKPIIKYEVKGQNYMAVTADKIASQAAIQILEKGGSAVDAAIAAQLVLNVVEPQSSGIGGGGFLVHYDTLKNKLISFDGRETAPKGATPDMFLGGDGKVIPFFKAVRSGKSVGVPGLLAMLEKAHKDYGKLPWKELFEPAIEVASKGFKISPRLHNAISYATEHTISPLFSKLYLSNGKPKPVGEILKNPKFAQILRTISQKGTQYFYSGEIAQLIAEAVQQNGGTLTIDDLAEYKAKERAPVCGNYRNYRVCSMGLPSSGGITLLQTLGILNNFELNKPYASQEIHLILEAEKLAFADRNYYLADSDFVTVPSNEKLLNTQYLKQRAGKILLNKASQKRANHGDLDVINGADKSYDAPSTSHISIVDKVGNAVSLTSSVEHSFGSGIVVNGFVLNNQLTDFSFMPEIDGRPVANAVASRKRSRSSMTPVIVFSPDGRLFAVLGSPGGSSIISYVRKTIIALIDWNMSIQDAINGPHFMHKNTQPTIESADDALINALTKIGHVVATKSQSSGVNAIVLNPDGTMTGASDPRREGVALGR